MGPQLPGRYQSHLTHSSTSDRPIGVRVRAPDRRRNRMSDWPETWNLPALLPRLINVATLRAGALLAAALLALAGCAGSRPAAPASATGTVSGLVLSAPSCPGPARIGHPCPPRPVDGAGVAALSGARQVAATDTGSDGRFQLKLPAGRYLIRATNIGGYRSTTEQVLSVTRDNVATLTLILDTGIR